ncbi:hypothetical protein BOTCAL_0192g00020 [Botryotinia calthae]|uniref:Uncharacterized protein n=1 Tax=Botryotinia calthae TaxID=38488 RepID=A0A4Y8D281_9HELO|nr:hypothetical protein BOTCAL_0192g00020 [Botryotinia calthae]
MKFTTTLTIYATLTVTAFAHRRESLQRCSTDSVLPCICPAGTDYWESSTWSVVGASANDVKDLIMDYYNSAWLGVIPYETRGPNNKPGVSIRTSYLPTKVGTFSVSEKLTDLKIDSRGGFIEKFEQLASTVPVAYNSGNGSFSGYWVTLESTYIFKHETAIRWSIYACETGNARNFAVFHENALKNVSSVLTAQGKIKGINLQPYSVQNF